MKKHKLSFIGQLVLSLISIVTQILLKIMEPNNLLKIVLEITCWVILGSVIIWFFILIIKVLKTNFLLIRKDVFQKIIDTIYNVINNAV